MDAPERIWASQGLYTTTPGGHWPEPVEYVRADILAATQRELAEVKVHGNDSFKLACMWQDQAKEVRASAEAAEASLAEARAECLEQARLNGLGGERELALQARVAEADRRIEVLEEVLIAKAKADGFLSIEDIASVFTLTPDAEERHDV